MTEGEIVEEVLARTKELAKLHAAPLRTHSAGERDFNFNNFWFKISFYVPKYWSLLGPKFGEIKTLAVYATGTYTNPLFWLNREASSPDGLWEIDKPACEGLLISLRASMILDDLAGISPGA